MRLQLATLSLCLLAACKTPIETTIYTADVAAVAKDGTPIETTAIVGVPAGSKDQCARSGFELAKAVQAGFGKAEFIECVSTDLETFANVRVRLPIVAVKTKATTALQIEVGDVAGQTGVVMRQDRAKIEAMRKALPKQAQTFADQPIDPQITVLIQNDSAAVAKVAMQGAFIDGKPYQLETVVELKRRDTVKIALSDVGNAALMGGGALLFWLQP